MFSGKEDGRFDSAGPKRRLRRVPDSKPTTGRMGFFRARADSKQPDGPRSTHYTRRGWPGPLDQNFFRINRLRKNRRKHVWESGKGRCVLNFMVAVVASPGRVLFEDGRVITARAGSRVLFETRLGKVYRYGHKFVVKE